MKKSMMKIMCGLVFGGALLWFLPSIGLCQDCSVFLFTGGPVGTPFPSIQAAINSAASFATIGVTGTCSENLLINESKNYISLIVPTGQTATIVGNPLSTQPTIAILGKGITVKGFTITGPRDVIQVARGGTATIDYNTIESTGGYGIVLAFNSYATIVDNTIQNNPLGGIVVTYNSFARIGIRSNSDTISSS